MGSKVFVNSILLITLMVTAPLHAQTEETGGEVSVDLNLRPRFEYRHGYAYPRLEEDKASAFISNRARVGLNFNNGFLSARMAAQEISGGDRRSRTTVMVPVSPCMKHGLSSPITATSQKLEDNRSATTTDESSRIKLDPTGIWHDALKMGYENNHNKLHLILAYNQSREKPMKALSMRQPANPIKIADDLVPVPQPDRIHSFGTFHQPGIRDCRSNCRSASFR